MKEASAHLGYVLEAYDAGLCPPDLTGMALVNLCRCELSNGEMIAAEKSIQRGLSLIKETGQKWLLAEAELQNSEVILVRGDTDKAISLCESTLKIIRELDAKPLEARAERILASALINKNEFEKASVCARSSISIAKDIGAKQEEGRSLIAMVEVLKMQGKGTELIEENLTQAISIFTQIGADGDLANAYKFKQSLA